MTPRTRAFSTTACVAGALLMSGCSGGGGDDPQPPADDTPLATLDEAALQRLEGIYERTGYGDLYAFANGRTTLYSLTGSRCVEVASFPGLAGLSEAEVSRTRYVLEGEQLSLALPGEAFVTRYDRLPTLPARCNDPVPRDAQGVFDHLWATFDEYYAFFELREVDWSAEYARQSPRVAEATDDESLFGLLEDLLSPIDDKHVFLFSETTGFSPAEPDGAERELVRGYQAQSEITDFGDFVDGVVNQLFEVLVARLDEGSYRQQGPLHWGTIDAGSTGYLFIESMAGYVLDELGDAEDASALEELNAASAAMDAVMADLATTSRMIVDLRLNGGGLDAISFDFAQRFVSERQLAFSKSARGRGVETVPVEAWLEPVASGAYLNPVTLIIGPDTVSAAETFTIPMHRLPQVTLIGETTAGALSDVLEKPLPNGWVTGLSNEIYLDAQGVGFEGVGVAPDVEVPVFRLDDIRAGVDQALDRALSLP